MVSNETKDLLYRFIVDKNGRATKNDVVSYMQKVEEKYRISRDTTLKEINAMQSQGIIEISKPERSGLPHYLSINSKNKFNQIGKILVAIERLIDMSEKPLKTTYDLFDEHMSTHDGKPDESCHDCEMLVHLKVDLEEWENNIHYILDSLLYETADRITDANMQWNLYNIITTHKIKLYNMLLSIGHENSSVYIVTIGKKETEYAREKGIPIDTLKMQLIEIVNIFRLEISRQPTYVKRKLV